MSKPSHTEILHLISNSGIQFHRIEINLDNDNNGMRSLGFYESRQLLSDEQEEVRLDYAIKLADDDIWLSKRELAIEGFLDENGKLLEDAQISPSLFTQLDPDTEVYSINDISKPLEAYLGKWLPFPYFETNSAGKSAFGPVNWCRIRLLHIGVDKKDKRYLAILAFDTALEIAYRNEGPKLATSAKTYQLCDDVDLLLNFTNSDYGCDFIHEYLTELLYGGRKNGPAQFPQMKYIAQFIYFIKYLQMTRMFPKVELHPTQVGSQIDVDLVLDIGNSNTCGVLFESPKEKNNFNFKSVKPLTLVDLSAPENEYNQPFSMRLAFHKCDFGEMGHQSDRFRWPSFIRVGDEAKRLVYLATNLTLNEGREVLSNYSSPKRYLWDNRESELQWELIRTEEDEIQRMIDLKGIVDQFGSDGVFLKKPGITRHYSRKSLMTFVFLEILAHANRQINSYQFRYDHGFITLGRRLRRIVVTCPTAMVKGEQIALRKCAEEASLALSRFYSNSYGNEHIEGQDNNKAEVIPASKELKKFTSEIEYVKDWMYDEATCCQFVYLYGEISKRYLNDCEKYFELYGKLRPSFDLVKKTLTVGSIDIGGGTTDLMICNYRYGDKGAAVLTPDPLFWESFSLAGDKLLKEIIRQIILEGQEETEEDKGCKGVIENYARSKGITGVEAKLNNFFGEDTNEIIVPNRKIRRHFVTQILVPIAEQYLQHANGTEDDKKVSFSDLFKLYKPSQDLLDTFAKKFGFRFEEIYWKLSRGKVNELIRIVFEPLIRQLCALLYLKGCDIVLLAGKVTSIRQIENLFTKHYPVSPHRLITLNKYRVGHWYPFQDNNGYFTDQKSIVAVGAAIALMGGKYDNLPGFRINLDLLKKKLTSTATFVGVYDNKVSALKHHIFDSETQTTQIHVDGFPVMLGFQRLKTERYPSRIFYLLEIDDAELAKSLSRKKPELNESRFSGELERYRQSLVGRSPFTFQLSRDYKENPEAISIESVEDCNGDDVSKGLFCLRLKTIDEDSAHWLDTGEFSLKIQSR